jgi:Rrf2 family protein
VRPIWPGSKMMKLSTRIRYGLRIMVQIAREANGSPVLARELSSQQNVSPAYVDQILIPLRSGGLVASLRGRNGGYRLGRPAEQITALDVVETIEGKLRLVECVDDPSVCERSAYCPGRKVWANMTTAMRDSLSGFTLAELAGNGAAADGHLGMA